MDMRGSPILYLLLLFHGICASSSGRVYLPNCPRTTIYEASERDYRVVAVTDAISGIYERGKLELEGIGVEPIRAEDCLRRLGAGATK